MDNNNSTPVDERLKREEIARLNKLHNNKSSVKSFIYKSPLYTQQREPRKDILNDDEIMEYAPYSFAAANIRLQKGLGSFSDKLTINSNNFFYSIVAAVLISVFSLPIALFLWNAYVFLLDLVIWLVLLIYIYYKLYLKDYTKVKIRPKREVNIKTKPKREVKTKKESKVKVPSTNSFKKYKETAQELESLYQSKEKIAIKLINKRFNSKSMTHDRFISTLKSSRVTFYKELSSIFSIIELNPEDKLIIREELDEKIDTLKTIIQKVDELSNELILNLSQSDSEDEEIKNLIEEMENLIGSVKDYK